MGKEEVFCTLAGCIRHYALRTEGSALCFILASSARAPEPQSESQGQNLDVHLPAVAAATVQVLGAEAAMMILALGAPVRRLSKEDCVS